MKSIFLVLLVLPLLLCGNEHVVVQLETEGKLIPTYMASIRSVESTFSAQHIKQLESILAFDLEHNGSMQLLRSKPDLEALTIPSELTQPKNLGMWKGAQIFYVVTVAISPENNLSARILKVNGGQVKSVHNIPLTGEISHDRRHIHRLADAIHKTLFGIDGIASKRILYTIKTGFEKGHEKAEVWESDYDGHNARRILKEEALVITPLYFPHPTGQFATDYLYVSYLSGVPKIYQASLNGGKGTRTVELRGNQLLPAISRQGNQVAFISDAAGKPDLFLVPYSLKEGMIDKPRQIFTSGHATQGTPSFSPDGKRIAFVSNKDGRPRIYVMDVPLPGANIRNLKPHLITTMNRESTAPQWSPDGKKIAYQARVDKTRQICVYNFMTQEEKQITTGPGDKENPTWAPNSQHILYNSKGDIYLIHQSHPQPTAVIKDKGNSRFPTWSY